MSPDKVQARKMVLVGVLLLGLISVYKNRGQEDGQSSFRTLWGVGVVGMFLSLLADFLPQIAGPFAVLIVLGSLTHGGEQILYSALGMIAPSPSSASSSPSSPPGPGSGSSPPGAAPAPAPAPG